MSTGQRRKVPASLKYAVIRGAFEALALSGVPRLVRARSACRGVIFTLHRVLPEPPADFAPNAILQVTPAFLAHAIERVRELGLEIVPLDEAIARIRSDVPGKPFVVFTFDDAYRDNRLHALPVLRRLNCPFTLYVPTGLVEGRGEIWWQALEDIIAREPLLAVPAGAGAEHFVLGSRAQKQLAYDTLHWRMRKMPEHERVALIRSLAAACGYDLVAQCRELIMGWDELREVAADPLATIGAHTVHHYELAKLPAEEARREIAGSIEAITAALGRKPVHLSYPIGGLASSGPREFSLAAELGLTSAVTTRPGGLYAADRARLLSLPRISLNGLFQARRYIDVFATGAIFSRAGRAGVG
jgi:peptidoglycan/xylan/chitin deacetylase (PgdA/CDA1 family)